MSVLSKEDEGTLGGLGLICAIIGTIVAGYVLRQNWEWFIEPQFGIETPSVPMCIGVMIVVRSMTYQYTVGMSEASANERAMAVISQILFPLFWLLIGFIVQLFI